jgi:hypothetical protein
VDLHLFTYPTYETFDPDTAFFFYADHSMEFGSGSRDLMTKNWKNLQLENTAFFFFYQTAIYWDFSLHLHKGRTSYRRSLHPSKENI